MIYQDIKTFYITSAKNNRMVKYELIRTQGDDHLVMVFEEQSKGIAAPKVIVQIDEFEITYESYRAEHKAAGFQTAIKLEFPPSYEGFVQIRCQEHRNKLD